VTGRSSSHPLRGRELRGVTGEPPLDDAGRRRAGVLFFVFARQIEHAAHGTRATSTASASGARPHA